MIPSETFAPAAGPPETAELGYYPFGAYLRRRFGCKAHKISLHAGFTCPNRDGSVGVGGCSYCVNESFNPQARGARRPVSEQMAEGIAYMRRRFGARKFIAYFQAFSNTYAHVETLRARYDEALGFPDVVGLAIGTRPDCAAEEVLDLIEGYRHRRPLWTPDTPPPTPGTLDVWVEYGIQSSHDATLARINRGHDYAAFVDAVRRTKRRGILVCAHVILGLPGETWDDMMETADRLAALDLDGIKLHHLYIARGTPMEKEYREGRVALFDAEDYVRVACDFLERTPPTVTAQRLVGDTTSGDVLVAPNWPVPKARVLRMFTEEFRRRGTHQGCRVTEP